MHINLFWALEIQLLWSIFCQLITILKVVNHVWHGTCKATPREESELKASATHIKNFDAFCISIQLVGTRIMLGGTRIALVLGTSNRRHCEICYEREALTYKFTSLK